MHVRDETGETGTRKYRNQRTVPNNKRFLCQFKKYIFRQRGKEGIYRCSSPYIANGKGI
jgi:hypothetical protein